MIPLSEVIRDRRGRAMLGRKERDQLELLITGSLRQLILMTMRSCASIVFSTFRGCEMKLPTCIASMMVGPASIPRSQSAHARRPAYRYRT
jgi:hypothetical protein